MLRFSAPRTFALALALTLAAAPAFADVVTTTFENSGYPVNPTDNNAGPSGQFVIDGNAYNNSFTPSDSGGFFYGWALSKTTDTTTPGPANQYSAITGSGANGSATYAVGLTYGTPAFSNTDPSAPGYSLTNPFHPSDTTITLAAGATPVSIDITNTTYAALAFRDGSAFGTPPFVQGDFQTLDIRGFTATGQLVNDVIVPLTDFSSADPKQWTVLDTWKTVDLTSLKGSSVLVFGTTSSQNDPTYGVNTPAYFAADDFVFTTAASAVPEPSAWVLALAGVAACLAPRARRASLPQVGPV